MSGHTSDATTGNFQQQTQGINRFNFPRELMSNSLLAENYASLSVE